MQNGLSVLVFSAPNAESDEGQRTPHLEMEHSVQSPFVCKTSRQENGWHWALWAKTVLFYTGVIWRNRITT